MSERAHTGMKKRTRGGLIGLGSGLALLCVVLFSEPFDREAPAALTVEALRNAEYFSEFPTGGKAKLTDGEYFEANEPGLPGGVRLTLLEFVAFADLNGNGIDDAVAILEASGGGTGRFRSLVAVVNEQGQPKHAASALLGDRVWIESLAIRDDRIVVQMIAHGPGDGQCCPSHEQTHAFRLEGDTLEQLALTLEQLQNTEYLSGFPARGTHMTLSEHVAFGDLNGDGAGDAVAVLIADSGGNGTFQHLAAVVNEGDQPRHAASALLGDRVRIESLAIQYGQIVVQMMAHGPDDPLCCPSRETMRVFQLAGDTLEAVPSIVDVLWRWERFEDTAGLRDITVPDQDKYTLRLLPDGTFQVTADCNTASGVYMLSRSRSSIGFGLNRSSQVACPPGSLSDTYLARLSEVVTYVLQEGKLVLNLMIDGGNMVFVDTGPAPQP